MNQFKWQQFASSVIVLLKVATGSVCDTDVNNVLVCSRDYHYRLSSIACEIHVCIDETLWHCIFLNHY